ncbi:hypothetical protein IAD21_04100 [Abditibacteriota bacterium]|nr:hypothetical protein IAD21_04100 [Abditibacteriota bacterium]
MNPFQSPLGNQGTGVESYFSNSFLKRQVWGHIETRAWSFAPILESFLMAFSAHSGGAHLCDTLDRVKSGGRFDEVVPVGIDDQFEPIIHF